MNDHSKFNSENILSILLADDDEDDQKIFHDAISEITTNVILSTFSNGIDLMGFLQNNSIKPDLLFLDINMPQKNGIDCLTEIRQNPNFSDLHIIIYSTSSYKLNIEDAYQRGADLYFMKPNSYTELVNSLKCILGLDWKKLRDNKGFENFIFTL